MAKEIHPTQNPENDPLEYYAGLNPKVFGLVPLTATRVLEVGCAKGKLGAAVKKRNPGSYYVGIELYEEAGKLARKLLDKVFISDVDHFDWSKLKGERFDCIIFADVLEHLIDPAHVFRNATALLTPDGSVVCCIPNVAHWSVLSELIRGEWTYTENGLLDRTHLRFFTLPSFKKFLTESGFEVIEEDRWLTEIDLHVDIFPFLKAMQVDSKAFVHRATTAQFIVRAQRIAKPLSARSTNGGIAGLDENVQKSVAIVITAGDRLQVTDACLDSIAAAGAGQGFGAPQVIVVDDASTDGTAAFLAEAGKKHPWLVSVRFERQVGLARARNRGAGITDADILVFMDGNSIVKSGWLEKMAGSLDDERVGVVSPQLLHPDGSHFHAGIVFTSDARPALLRRPVGQDDPKVNRSLELPAVTGACIMIRRALFQELEGFSPDDPIFYADLDLCFKVRRKGLAVVCQSGSRVIQAVSENSAAMAMTQDESEKSRMIFIQKWKDLMMKDLREDPHFFMEGKDYPCK